MRDKDETEDPTEKSAYVLGNAIKLDKLGRYALKHDLIRKQELE